MTESALAAVARAAADQSASSGTQPAGTTQPTASPPTPPDPAVLAAARQDGIQAERARCKAILTAEAAQDRGKLASYFAFDTDMSAEQATAALAVAPKVEASSNPFLSAMRSEQNPNLGTGAAASEPADIAGPSLAALMAKRIDR